MSTQHLTDDFVRGLQPPAKSNKVHFDADVPSVPFSGVTGFGIRITAAGCRAFVFQYRMKDGSGRQHIFTIGKYPHINVERARLLARKLREDVEIGVDPHATKAAKRIAAKRPLEAALTLHDIVASKFASFLKRNIEPAGYLYRHYDPSGDLLYAGITQGISERSKAHLSKATWKDFICMIVVEPFETREELLEAEHDAILNEFPKYNRVFNKRLHPIQELEKRTRRQPYISRRSARRQENDQRYRNVLARRAAVLTADEPDVFDLLRQVEATEKEEAAAEKAAAEKAAVGNLVHRTEAAQALGISDRTLAKMRPPTTLVKRRAYVDMEQLRQMIVDRMSSPRVRI